jgi:rhomboid protease GluP
MNENTPPDGQYPRPLPPQPRPIQVAVPGVKPVATYAILGFTVFVYLLQLAGLYLVPAAAADSLLSIFRISISGVGSVDVVALMGEKIDVLIRAGQVWRLITPVFLHDSALPYGLLHIGFNMYALVLFGRGLEARYGHWRFVLLYFL